MSPALRSRFGSTAISESGGSPRSLSMMGFGDFDQNSFGDFNNKRACFSGLLNSILVAELVTRMLKRLGMVRRVRFVNPG